MTVLAGCQQQEELQSQYPVPQSQYPVPQSQLPAPSGPIQGQGEVQMLKEVVRKDPVNVNAWIKLGNILMDTARYNEAVDAYQKALEIDPSNVDVRVDMGTCYRRIGKSERAVEEYRKALEYNPDHLFGHMNLGIVLAYDFRNYSEAIREFEKYLEISPNAQNARVIRNEIQNLKAASRTSR